MNKQKIILDCDPGHDDTIAILLAAKEETIELLGITVIAGNQSLNDTRDNTLYICQTLDIHTPVYVGCDKPMVREQVLTTDVHGIAGFRELSRGTQGKCNKKKDAVTFMIDTLLASSGDITVVTMGPMTNLATAIKREPKLVRKIKQIVLMGGSCGSGNITPVAEFNIFADAEAAQICFESGVPITMIGLDVTRQVLCDNRVIERMQKLHTKESKFFVQIMEHACKIQKEIFGIEEMCLHDPVTIAYLIDNTILKLQPMCVKIEIDDETLYGKTSCEMLACQDGTYNAEVAVDIDVEKFWAVVELHLTNAR